MTDHNGLERSRATDELRRLLDERGVEHTTRDGMAVKNTYWNDECGRRWGYTEDITDSGITSPTLFLVSGQVTFTPEQAIRATLGLGTCHIDVKDNFNETDGLGYVWLECDACSWQMPLEPSTPRFNYCPNCGAKVVG